MNDSTPPTTKRKGCRWQVLLLILLALALIAGGLWWWFNRPITPVELSTGEKLLLDQKLEAIQPDIDLENLPEGEIEQPKIEVEPPAYEKGKKEFEITERELNGLLNEHTKLADQVRFELLDGAVHARVAMDLDQDIPIVGGKKLKARARFFVDSSGDAPSLVLDDLTVWGISLPNDWLGGLKGQNLLGEILGADGKKGPGLTGIEKLEVQRGRLLIKLKE